MNYISIKNFFLKPELTHWPPPSAHCALPALGLRSSLTADPPLPKLGPWAGGSWHRGAGQGWLGEPWGHSCRRIDLWSGGSQGENECGLEPAGRGSYMGNQDLGVRMFSFLTSGEKRSGMISNEEGKRS